MRCSVIDGSFYMVMFGLAETFFSLFILEMFESPVASGLILTVPLMLASLAQLASPNITRWAKSYRRIATATAWLQAIACVPLAIIAFRGSAPMWLVFVIVTIYHCGAIVGGAPWSTLMSLLVPVPLRARFFASRNRKLQIGAISGVAIGALLLEYASVWMPRVVSLFGSAGLALPESWVSQPQLPAFGALFLLAAMARAVSATYLGLHREPIHASSTLRILSISQLLDRVRKGPGATLIARLCLFQFAMMIGSPFWAAYVKDIAHASFLQWASMIICWMLGRALAVRWAGEIAATHGRDRLILVAALLMAPCPALWTFSTNIVWLVIAQLFCGMAIACWDFSVWLSTVSAFPEEERTSMLAKFGLLQYTSGAAGSYAGGSLLKGMGDTRTAFIWTFVASTIARTLVFGWLAFQLRREHAKTNPVASTK